MPDLAEILPDLFGIEVNTVIKDQMTAEKMPSLPHALLDILIDYAKKLETYGVDLSPFFNSERIDDAKAVDSKSRTDDASPRRKPDLRAVFPSDLLRHRPSRQPFNFDSVTNGWISFEIIRLIARYLMAVESSKWSQKLDITMLERIRRNCNELTSILRTLEMNPDPGRVSWWRRISMTRLDPAARWDEVLDKTRSELLSDDLRRKRLPLETVRAEEMVRVRKIWEIGTETVLVQTSIQIDGDVVTRLGTDLLSGRYEKFREPIIEAHRQSVGVSLDQWNGLVKVAVELVKSVVGGLFGRRAKT